MLHPISLELRQLGGKQGTSRLRNASPSRSAPTPTDLLAPSLDGMIPARHLLQTGAKDLTCPISSLCYFGHGRHACPRIGRWDALVSLSMPHHARAAEAPVPESPTRRATHVDLSPRDSAFHQSDMFTATRVVSLMQACFSRTSSWSDDQVPKSRVSVGFQLTCHPWTKPARSQTAPREVDSGKEKAAVSSKHASFCACL